MNIGNSVINPFKFVYEFNQQHIHGEPELKNLLGEKGVCLAKMHSIGLPVPQGFTISTQACTLFHQDKEAFRQQVWPEVLEALQRLEGLTDRQLGEASFPLLLSVRSGTQLSMPGMLDTVLNIGLNDCIVNDLLQQNEEAELIYDCYRRLLQMFGTVVLNIPRRNFEKILASQREKNNVPHNIEFRSDELMKICEEFQELIKNRNEFFPQDPLEQLRLSVEAVFLSWNNPRAIIYRQLNDIPEDLGTAISVQMMVLGNRKSNSASGIIFTRNPSTGDPTIYGKFLPRSQGEELTTGIRTPLVLEKMQQFFPDVHQKLHTYAADLEKEYREMQEFKFVIETGKIYALRTSTGKRTDLAAVRIARDMYREGLISREEAVMRVNPEQLKQLLHPVFQHTDEELFSRGLPASPGTSVGQIVFSANDAIDWSQKGKSVVLVCSEIFPADIEGMKAAQAILTTRGGMTSHAAILTREMGKCCVVGCENLQIDEKQKTVKNPRKILNEGDYVSVDGNNGKIFLGKLQQAESISQSNLIKEYFKLLGESQTLDIGNNPNKAADALISAQAAIQRRLTGSNS